MELFRDPKFDFLGKKWFFITGSLLLIALGVTSVALKGGLRYGIDFRGGTLMYVKFTKLPPLQKIRKAVSERVKGEVSVQEILGSNEVMISTELKNESELNDARKKIVKALSDSFGVPGGKPDFNNMGAKKIADRLRLPLQRAGVPMSDAELADLAAAMRKFRDTPPRSGLISNFDQLKAVKGVTPAVIATMKHEFNLAPFAIRSVEIVGPKIGKELRRQAVMATLLALAGMLIYVAFRFEWIYGVAAVIAVFHDVLITVGLFSVTNKEISLTVVAALLTLVGYSMNDTIVVFDRIRENLKIVRRGSFSEMVNLSINQTLSRTVLTSGLTFLTVVALFLFGGQVLNGFAFALVVGILVGTYSSIFIASPILVFWQDMVERRKRARIRVASAPKGSTRKRSAKVVR